MAAGAHSSLGSWTDFATGSTSNVVVSDAAMRQSTAVTFPVFAGRADRLCTVLAVSEGVLRQVQVIL